MSGFYKMTFPSMLHTVIPKKEECYSSTFVGVFSPPPMYTTLHFFFLFFFPHHPRTPLLFLLLLPHHPTRHICPDLTVRPPPPFLSFFLPFFFFPLSFPLRPQPSSCWLCRSHLDNFHYYSHVFSMVVVSIFHVFTNDLVIHLSFWEF